MENYKLKLERLSFWALYYKGELIFRYPVTLTPECLCPWQRLQFIIKRYETLYFQAG